MKYIKKYLPLLLMLSILPILLAADISGATLKAPFTIDNVGATDAKGVPTSWTMEPGPLQDAGLLNAAGDNIAVCAAADCTGANDIPILLQVPDLYQDSVYCFWYDGYTGSSWAPNCATSSSSAETLWSRNYTGSYFQVESPQPFTSFHFDQVTATSIPLEGLAEWQYQTCSGGWAALDVLDRSNKFGNTCGGPCTVSFDMPDQWYVDTGYKIRLYQTTGTSGASNGASFSGGTVYLGNALWYSPVASVDAGATEVNTMYLGGPSMGGGGATKFPIYHGTSGMAWSGNPYYYPPYYGMRLEISGYFQVSEGTGAAYPRSCGYSIVCFQGSGYGFQLWVEAPGELAAAMDTSSYGYTGGPGRFDSIPITDGYHTLVIDTPASCSYTCGYAYVDGVQVATMHSTWSYFSAYGSNPFIGGSGAITPTTAYNRAGMTYVDYIKYDNYGNTSQSREWTYDTQWDGKSAILDTGGNYGYPTMRGMPCTVPWMGYACAIGGGGTTVNDYYYRPGSTVSSYPVVATIGAFESTAAAPPAADTSLPPMDVVSANYLTTGQFAADTSLGTLPGSGFINSAAASANIPAKFLWVLISCGVVMLVIGAAMKFLKNIVLACVIGGIVLTGFAVPAVGVYPMWVVFFYAVIATVVVIIGRRFGVSV